MKKFPTLFVLVFVFVISGAIAQTSGSSHEMNRLLSKTLKYPTELRQSDTQGMVVISIQVDENGYMSDYEFLSGDLGFESEIERTVSILKEDWDPSFLEEKNYNQEYLMSFDFKLSKGGQFPPNPFTSTVVTSTPTTPLEALNKALKKNPYSAKLLSNRAEIFELDGKHLLAQMDLNQAEFLKDKMLTEIVIVGYAAQGPKSL